VLFGNFLPSVEPHVEGLFHMQDSCPCICMDLFACLCENSNETYYPFSFTVVGDQVVTNCALVHFSTSF
jgi:hypothetical protein